MVLDVWVDQQRSLTFNGSYDKALRKGDANRFWPTAKKKKENLISTLSCALPHQLCSKPCDSTLDSTGGSSLPQPLMPFCWSFPTPLIWEWACKKASLEKIQISKTDKIWWGWWWFLGCLGPERHAHRGEHFSLIKEKIHIWSGAKRAIEIR